MPAEVNGLAITLYPYTRAPNFAADTEGAGTLADALMVNRTLQGQRGGSRFRDSERARARARAGAGEREREKRREREREETRACVFALAVLKV